jgi:ATP-dependent exoDNAse (exonuclease V) beta subunit
VDGALPSDQALGDPGGLAEEHRLFYVAVTRARDHLYLYAPQRLHYHRRGRDDRHEFGQLEREGRDATKTDQPARLNVPKRWSFAHHAAISTRATMQYQATAVFTAEVSKRWRRSDQDRRGAYADSHVTGGDRCACPGRFESLAGHLGRPASASAGKNPEACERGGSQCGDKQRAADRAAR